MKKKWLLKSEPDTFSIDDLQNKGSSLWDGVRNYQARNFLMEMKPGDEAIFYHSNANPPGAAGVAIILDSAKVDPTQFNPESEYFDSKATIEKPRWFCPEVGFKKKFSRLVPLGELREHEKLRNMTLLQKGSRLSVTPLVGDEFATIVDLGSSKKN
ncbi:MAG: EVE domain-containing protein [bacterium]|nr:EVE domain-containing protein [bacterium]